MRRLKIVLLVCFAFILTGRNTSNAQKYVCHGVLNLDSDPNNAIPVMNKLVAAGCNATMLTVPL